MNRVLNEGGKEPTNVEASLGQLTRVFFVVVVFLTF